MTILHPALSFTYYIAMILLTCFVRNPVVTLSALVGGLCHWAFFTTAKEKREDLGFYLPLAALVTLANPVFSHNGKTPFTEDGADLIRSTPVSADAENRSS